MSAQFNASSRPHFVSDEVFCQLALMRRCSLGVLFAFAVFVFPVPSANAQFETVTIAITGDDAPDNDGTFSSFTPAIFGNSGAVFRGSVANTSNGDGIFRGAGGNVTQIARTGQAAPDSDGLLNGFVHHSANANGTAAFYALLSSTANNSGVFSGNGGAITQIARNNGTGPDGFVFNTFSLPSINILGDVAFRANNVAGELGIFRGAGGALAQIVRTGQNAPGNGTFSNISDPTLDDSGGAIFFANLTGTTGGSADNSGLFRGNGSAITTIVRKGDAAPGGGTFADFGIPSGINGSGQVVFRNLLNGTSANDGIFRGDVGSMTQIVRKGDAAPGGDGTFLGFNSRGTINENGDVAFLGVLTGNSGGSATDTRIYRGSGGALTELASEGQIVPGASGALGSGFTNPLFNNAGVVAFRNSLSGATSSDNVGLYLTDGQDLVEVARKGQAIEGSSLRTISFNDESGGINEFGQVAYHATLNDFTRSGLFLFTPVVKYRATGSGAWDSNANWTLSLAPGAPHIVTIDPDSVATVTGPSNNTMVSSLTVGGGAGVATLALQAGATVTVTNGLTVESTGVLAGTGAIVGDTTINGGLAIGDSPGVMDFTGKLELSSTSDFDVDIFGTGTIPGDVINGYDQAQVTGSVFLGEGTLSLNLSGYTAADGSLFFLIRNDGTDLIDGQFLGFSEGATLVSGDQSFLISYQGNAEGIASFSGGNDLVLLSLTSVPEPGSLAVLLACGGLVAVWRRRKVNA